MAFARCTFRGRTMSVAQSKTQTTSCKLMLHGDYSFTLFDNSIPRLCRQVFYHVLIMTHVASKALPNKRQLHFQLVGAVPVALHRRQVGHVPVVAFSRNMAQHGVVSLVLHRHLCLAPHGYLRGGLCARRVCAAAVGGNPARCS